jgi:hypothetical protein
MISMVALLQYQRGCVSFQKRLEFYPGNKDSTSCVLNYINYSCSYSPLPLILPTWFWSGQRRFDSATWWSTHTWSMPQLLTKTQFINGIWFKIQYRTFKGIVLRKFWYAVLFWLSFESLEVSTPLVHVLFKSCIRLNVDFLNILFSAEIFCQRIVLKKKNKQMCRHF